LFLATPGNSKSADTDQAESPITAVEWQISSELVAYPAAVEAMEARVAAIRTGNAPELVWLLEHPPLYTAGTSARLVDLVDPHRLPVHSTGRGGQLTYHGPGQRVVYLMLDLRQRGADLRAYVRGLEDWIVAALAELGIRGEIRTGRIGIWVAHPDGREDKIAAIGVRIRHWITYHGISINVAPDLTHYDGIVPCGIRATENEPFGVTSLQALGNGTTMRDVDAALRRNFDAVLGPGSVAAAPPSVPSQSAPR
jgi:lipoyl(octanoyl) transferase